MGERGPRARGRSAVFALGRRSARTLYFWDRGNNGTVAVRLLAGAAHAADADDAILNGGFPQGAPIGKTQPAR